MQQIIANAKGFTANLASSAKYLAPAHHRRAWKLIVVPMCPIRAARPNQGGGGQAPRLRGDAEVQGLPRD
jgi:hypothetical protein